MLVSIHASVREATVLDCQQGQQHPVSIHASVREATLTAVMVVPDSLFQSTPPCGRRLSFQVAPYVRVKVSIHASVREATRDIFSCLLGYGVSIHASVREATPACILATLRQLFQSTPPCGRRRPREPGRPHDHGVSIHASVREATNRPAHQMPPFHVSIHASVREATAKFLASHRRLLCFNPRLRAGGDPQGLGARKRYSKFQSTPPCGRRPLLVHELRPCVTVSIHASVREATTATPGSGDTRVFQSTPPCGRRRTRSRPLTRRTRCFNPRLRAGGDLARLHASIAEHVSIHASVREATMRAPGLNVSPIAFQSTPPCGRRPAQWQSNGAMLWFQSTPPCGRRRRVRSCARGGNDVSIHASVREATSMAVSCLMPALFQSTPPCGRRRRPPAVLLPLVPVSIHASVREATTCGQCPRPRY